MIFFKLFRIHRFSFRRLLWKDDCGSKSLALCPCLWLCMCWFFFLASCRDTNSFLSLEVWLLTAWVYSKRPGQSKQ